MDIQAFGVEEWLNEWETQAKYDIAGSSIASMTLEEVLALGDGQEVMGDLLQAKMNYGWIEGSPAFKEEVAKLYVTVSVDSILQTNGATGANHLAIYALIQPGDHVISLYPSYQQLYDIPRSFGAEVDLWRIDEKRDWLPDLEDLKSLLRPNTKMICINNANNPTGSVMTREFLEKVVELARSVGAYILSDEVYQPLEEGMDVPAIVDLYEKGISTNSLSKTYSIPGIRVGWVAANKELSDLFRKYRDYTMICAGVIDDALATHVLKNKAAILERNRRLVEGNLRILQDWVEHEPHVQLVFPKQVSTSFIRLDIPEDTESFCLRLLQEEGVLLVPGNRFDMPGYARLGYCTHRSILQEGLKRLSAFLRQFDDLD
ncbi:aminotransferase [Streptococcus suis]|nr:aminotransferase [Streptococcus suis]